MLLCAVIVLKKKSVTDKISEVTQKTFILAPPFCPFYPFFPSKVKGDFFYRSDVILMIQNNEQILYAS